MICVFVITPQNPSHETLKKGESDDNKAKGENSRPESPVDVDVPEKVLGNINESVDKFGR